MLAIEVHFVGPSNYHGDRYIAQTAGKKHTFPERYNLTPTDNAVLAAKALVKYLDWNYGPWYCGETHRGTWVFVCDTIGTIHFNCKE